MKKDRDAEMFRTSLGDRELSPESLMMGYGYRPDWSQGAVKCPIFQTSTFVFESAEDGKAFFEVAYGLREPAPAEALGLIYSRLNNPDLEILEDRLTLWDEAGEGAVFQSGMASIATTLFTFLRPGDVMVHSEPLYGGTDYLLNHVLTDFGVDLVPFGADEESRDVDEAVAEATGKGRLRMIYVETPANPTNRLVDISRCAELAEELSDGAGTRSSAGGSAVDAGSASESGTEADDGSGAGGGADADGDRVLVAVDNTFLGPLWQHPLKLGADLVLYSLTKYVGGHSDLIAGACLGSEELVSAVKGTRTFFGTMADPWTGWMLMRSLETLKLRMTCQMKNARYVADSLVDHPKVERVYYLGHLHEDDPQREIYARQCLAPGGMISFDLFGGEAEAFRFLNELKLIKLAVSLGGTESLAEHPATMTHADIEPDEQRRMGITPAMVRLSIGVEDPQDLIADVEQALEAV